MGVKTPVPNSNEQQRIADFLDQKTAEIDEAISKKQRLIELLEERKAILINQAVTRGLNPDVPMKYSGVEWIGQIPTHWGVYMAKFIFRQLDYGLSESAKSEGEYRYLNMGHIINGRVILDDSSFIDSVSEYFLLEKFDLIYNRTNSFNLVGKSGIFLGNKENKVTFASYLVRFRVNENIDPEWTNFLLSDIQFLAYIRSLALRSLHQANLNPNRFRAVHIPVPPKEEQFQISQELNVISEEYERHIDHVRTTIKTYEEMKKVLISEAVTGKIKI